jgi:hypothetical protein
VAAQWLASNGRHNPFSTDSETAGEPNNVSPTTSVGKQATPSTVSSTTDEPKNSVLTETTKEAPHKRRIVKKIIKRLVYRSKDGKIIRSTAAPEKVLTQKVVYEEPEVVELPQHELLESTQSSKTANDESENDSRNEEVRTDVLETSGVAGPEEVEPEQKAVLSPVPMDIVNDDDEVYESQTTKEVVPRTAVDTKRTTGDILPNTQPLSPTQRNHQHGKCDDVAKTAEEDSQKPASVIKPLSAAKLEGEIVVKNGKRMRIIKRKVVKRKMTKDTNELRVPSKQPKNDREQTDSELPKESNSDPTMPSSGSSTTDSEGKERNSSLYNGLDYDDSSLSPTNKPKLDDNYNETSSSSSSPPSKVIKFSLGDSAHRRKIRRNKLSTE